MADGPSLTTHATASSPLQSPPPLQSAFVPAPFDPAAPPTGAIVFADGQVVYGEGFGAVGEAVGELCFNTAMTGYQEILTDPSYAGQIITFTFPHIGIVGANATDHEAPTPHALGMVVRERITAPSNHRAEEHLTNWLARHGQIGICGVDTRALTHKIRAQGAPTVVIAHAPNGVFDIAALTARARAWGGLAGADLAIQVSRPAGAAPFSAPPSADTDAGADPLGDRPHIVAIDYGMKAEIYARLTAAGAQVTVVPATADFATIAALKPDGLFLSNGPGDPAATATHAVPLIRQWLDTGKPLFGICLGHQLLGLALGAKTVKMHQGHRGANHPVQRVADGAVEITSMNHGFAVDSESLPPGVRPTHVSLFDSSLCGLETDDGRAFGVQYHPEASPGPRDSGYLFTKFVDAARGGAGSTLHPTEPAKARPNTPPQTTGGSL